MQALDALGDFWLEGYDEDSLSGRLTFSPAKGTSLEVVGRFDNESDGLQIHGWAGNNEITLNDCWGPNDRFNSPGVSTQRFGANRMFIGHHLDSDDLRFKSVYCEFSHLTDWLDLPGWTETASNHGRRREIIFSLTDEMKCNFSSGVVSIRFREDHDRRGAYGVTLRQQPMLCIEYDAMQSLHTIRRDVGRVQSLLTLCLDSPVEIDRFVLRRPDVHQRALSGDDMGFEKDIELRTHPLRHVPSEERKPIHQFRMLLTFTQLGGIDLLAAWLDQSQRFQRVLDYMIAIHQRPMYMENRFLNVVGAAEAFQRLADPTSLVPKSEFEDLYRKYLEITPVEHRDWLRGKLAFAIEPSLKNRLLLLARQSNEATSKITGDTSAKRQRWAWTVATLRNWLAHVVVHAQEVSGNDMRLLGDSVYAVLRICLLLDCGLDPSKLPSLRESHAHATTEDIDDVVTRVRNVLLRVAPNNSTDD